MALWSVGPEAIVICGLERLRQASLHEFTACHVDGDSSYWDSAEAAEDPATQPSVRPTGGPRLTQRVRGPRRLTMTWKMTTLGQP